MGYYDNEPEAGESAPIVEMPSAQLESVDAAISEDVDGNLGDGLRKLGTPRPFGW